MTGGSRRIARAVYRSCSLPNAPAPYDRLSLKVFYPAVPDDGVEQRNAGLVPADRSGGPYPLVIVMPGINVGPESYAWLARDLAVRGHVIVTYSMIAEEMPGYISLTPGLDLSAITPDSYGSKSSATALAALIDCMRSENETGVLEGCIDVDRCVLVGHSAGGSVALYNANRDWFPEVCGAVAYGAHAGASKVLGFEDDTILELPSNVPLMLIGGDNDGVIAASAARYGREDGDALQQLRRTFDEGISSSRNDSYLVELSGANHFSLAHPIDESTGRRHRDDVAARRVRTRFDCIATAEIAAATYRVRTWQSKNRPVISSRPSPALGTACRRFSRPTERTSGSTRSTARASSTTASRWRGWSA